MFMVSSPLGSAPRVGREAPTSLVAGVAAEGKEAHEREDSLDASTSGSVEQSLAATGAAPGHGRLVRRSARGLFSRVRKTNGQVFRQHWGAPKCPNAIARDGPTSQS